MFGRSSVTFLIALALLSILCIPDTRAADLQDLRKALSLNRDGEKLVEQGKYPDAIRVFSQMLASCGSHKFCRGVATYYLGRCYLETSRFPQASELLDRAQKLFLELKRDNEYAMVVANKAKLAAARGQYTESLRLFRDAEDRFLATENRKELFLLYNSMAVVLAYTGDYVRALARLDKAEQLLGRRDSPESLAVLNNNRGLVLARRQHHDKALRCFTSALQHYDAAGSLKGRSVVLNNIGHVHESQSHYAKALTKHQESLDIAARIRDPGSEALALNNIGCVHLKRGNYQAARDAFQRALAIREQLGIKHFAAETLNNLGLVWLAHADYPRAAACFERSYTTCDAVGSLSGAAWALHNRAFLFKDQGKFRESLLSSERAVQIARRIGDRRLESTAMLRLGNLYEYQGWFDRAVENYVKAAEIQQEIGDTNFQAHTLVDVANILARLGECEEAEHFFRKALRLKKRIAAPYGDCLCKFALFLLERPQYCESTDRASARGSRDAERRAAWKLLEEADRLTGPGQNLSRMLLLYVMGRYFLETDPVTSVDYFSRLQARAESSGVRKFSFLASVGLGMAYESQQQWTRARTAYEGAVTYAEQIRESLDPYAKLSFLHGEEILGVKHAAPYEGLARVLMRMGEREQSLRYAEYTKARSFAEALSRRSEAVSVGLPRSVAARDRHLENRLAVLLRGLERAYLSGAAEAVESYKKRIRDVQGQMERHVKMLREHHPLYAATRYPRPTGLKDSALRAGEWVLAFEVTDSGFITYLLHGKQLVQGQFTPITRNRLDRLVRAFRNPMEIGPENAREKLGSFDFTSGKALGDLLLGKALHEIPEGASLKVIPDDCLGTLPFEMLVLNNAGTVVQNHPMPEITGATFFGDRNVVSYYQSITALTLARVLGSENAPSDRALVFADPVFNRLDARVIHETPTRLAEADGKFSLSLMEAMEESSMGAFTFRRLPLTGDLAEAVAQVFDLKCDIFTGLKASKQCLFKEIAPDLERYRAIVFATHGFFTQDNPSFREPVLVLTLMPAGTDGFVRMSEVMGLKMNSDIVALTACQTGLGRQISGEGTMGMGRAFQYAGARSVLMTLWSVSQRASVSMMQSFFEHLAEGKTKLEALKLARNHIRKNGFDHPFFWASFILFGEVD